MRLVALFGAFVVLFGGYATYVGFFRPVPEFTGATDAAHVAAVKALVADLPAPAGAGSPLRDPLRRTRSGLLDQHDRAAQGAGLGYHEDLGRQGGRVRSHQCVKPEPPGGKPVDAWIAPGLPRLPDRRGGVEPRQGG